MDIEMLRNYCIAKPFVTESFPFGETTLVFKVKGKIFLLLSLDEIPRRFNVKCDPELAVDLRENFPDQVLPGYHMNKKHWNTIVLDGFLKPAFIMEQVDNSYKLVDYKSQKK